MSYVSGRVVDPQWVWELALRSRLSANLLDLILSERKDAKVCCFYIMEIG